MATGVVEPAGRPTPFVAGESDPVKAGVAVHRDVLAPCLVVAGPDERDDARVDADVLSERDLDALVGLLPAPGLLERSGRPGGRCTRSTARRRLRACAEPVAALERLGHAQRASGYEGQARRATAVAWWRPLARDLRAGALIHGRRPATGPPWPGRRWRRDRSNRDRPPRRSSGGWPAGDASLIQGLDGALERRGVDAEDPGRS